MGMDIHGLNPKSRSEEPQIDWETSDQETRYAYLDKKRIFQQENPGYYFRANVWSWRPMAEIIIHCNEVYNLDLPIEFINQLHYNSGGGLKTQEECDILANFLETYARSNFEGWEYIGLNTSWFYKKVVNAEGDVTSTSVSDEEGDKIARQLGFTVFVKEGEIEVDGFNYNTSHGCSVKDLEDFIKFLRECGGFAIH